MSLKTIITSTYGSRTYKKRATLQEVGCKAERAKNQVTFLNGCIHHKIIPRFLQIKSPVQSRGTRNITEEHRRKLLIATKTDTQFQRFWT